MSEKTLAVHLIDGRVEEFETITVLEHAGGDWIRCTRPEPSSREKLPETTKYYKRENVARIERIGQNGIARVIDSEQLDFTDELKKIVSK